MEIEMSINDYLILLGYVFDIDALVLGVACGALGGSRARASDIILPAVGMELLVSQGQLISEGQPWAKLHHEIKELPSDVESQLNNAITISYSPSIEAQTRILEVMDWIRITSYQFILYFDLFEPVYHVNNI